MDWQRYRARLALRDAGFDVDTARDRYDAFAHGCARHYDAVIVDLGLDDSDEPSTGLALIRDMRQEGLDFPILVWSHFHDWKTHEASRRAGADAYVIKSSDMTGFIAAVMSMIRRWKEQHGKR